MVDMGDLVHRLNESLHVVSQRFVLPLTYGKQESGSFWNPLVHGKMVQETLSQLLEARNSSSGQLVEPRQGTFGEGGAEDLAICGHHSGHTNQFWRRIYPSVPAVTCSVVF
ncbi:UNVERIFIED_CONTAM: hypothetical protein Sangu_1973400 [Sesamum angustifolium]|uniref:Uncharacterized protein n=1 Tax=Sesamum angustifolium TaxID=2727405 RepID=A0AAW2LZD2_9LAMI